MDQREHDIEEDLKSILCTRMALMDKLQSLEHRVEDTVRGTKETAMDTIEAAKHKALQWVTSTTGRLTSYEMLRRRPPIVAGGIVAMGLLAAWMIQRKQYGRSGVYPYFPPQAKGADVLPQEARPGVYPYYTPQAGEGKALPQGEGSRQRSGESYSIDSPQPSPTLGTKRNGSGEANAAPLSQQVSEFLDGLKGEVTHERTRLQQAALQIGRSFARDMVQIAGQSLVSLMNHLSTGSRDQSRQNQLRGR